MLPGKILAAPVRNLIPGRDLAEDDLYQIDERVLFERKDYDRIASLGWNEFWTEHYEEMSGKPFQRLTTMQTLSNQLFVDDTRICEERGMPIFLGVAVDSVLMAFSLCRTLTEFTKDLHEVPDKVEAAMQASCDEILSNAIECCKRNGKMAAFLVLERGSGFYYRMEIFERFEWPFLQRYVDAFVSEGILPWLHFDTDWGMNLPYLKKLPKGKCVCDLDSTTDIFRAKEILGGHMCISGDVPAALLSLGEPDQVADYCKRLIDEVGDGGGFMLTSGCECPIDVKPENLRAMVETGRSYRGKKTIGTTAPAYVEKEVAARERPKGKIAEALGNLQYQGVEDLVEGSLAAGTDPLEILDECKAGMDTVGELYSSGEYFLSELILSADMFTRVVNTIKPLIAERRGDSSHGSVVIGTTKGDVHDLGKNIVVTLFEASGFDVTDLGVDVDPEAFVEEISRKDAKIVAMSALITPAFGSMKRVVDLMKEKGLREERFVIIGGGPTSEAVRDHVGADAWTLNPVEGINMCREFLA
jgi:methylmalonyl-CoA mutase cobalamin-binding domain/chain